jgi:hypothetical protein
VDGGGVDAGAIDAAAADAGGTDGGGALARADGSGVAVEGGAGSGVAVEGSGVAVADLTTCCASAPNEPEPSELGAALGGADGSGVLTEAGGGVFDTRSASSFNDGRPLRMLVGPAARWDMGGLEAFGSL